MVVDKRQGWEKHTKVEQMKVQPQVEQTALLDSPIYTGQVQGKEGKEK